MRLFQKHHLLTEFPGIKNLNYLNDLNSLNNLSGFNDLTASFYQKTSNSKIFFIFYGLLLFTTW